MIVQRVLDLVGGPIFRWPNRRALAILESSGNHYARLIASAAQGNPRQDGIESERRRMLSSQSPLVVGDHGLPGPFDEGKTISAACRVSKRRRAAEFLGAVTESFAPKIGIELGTNVGISAAYIATAMPGGKLVTLEASPYRIAQARRVHDNLGLRNVEYVQGLFADTLPETLQRLGHVDFAFIDGHHQYQPTLDYFDAIHPFMLPGSVVVFDDIRWSKGMRRAWKEIRSDGRIGVAVDFYHYGVCVLGAGTGMPLVAGPIWLY